MIKQLEDIVKNKRILLYQLRKVKREIAFEVYSDGTVIIQTTIVKAGIHLPIKIHKWVNIVKSSNEEANEITVDFFIKIDDQIEHSRRNQQVIILEKTNGWFMNLKNKIERQKDFNWTIGAKVTCIIQGLHPTKQFYLVKKMFEQITIEEDHLQELFSRENQGSKFTIYQTNTGHLQIECYCAMGETGRLDLSDGGAGAARARWPSA